MEHVRNLSFAWVGMAVLLSVVESHADDALANWPQWRGPTFNGVAPQGDPPVRWSESENVRWQVAIDGRGNATPIVWEDRVFVLTAVPLRKTMAPRFEAPSVDDVDDNESVDNEDVIVSWSAQALTVVCLDRLTGRERWRRVAAEVMPHQGHHWKGSFASASPITDGDRVYAYFGSFGLFCYDMQGSLVWQTEFGPQVMEDSFGEGSSPALWGDTLVVVVDHELDSFIVAIDKRNGAELWKSSREEISNWSTPCIIDRGGSPQVLVNGETVCCYDLTSGELLWECGGQSESAVPAPVANDTLAFATSGFDRDTLHAIQLGNSGDLTGTEHVAWTLDRGTPYVPSPLLWGDEIYILEDRSFFSCLNISDGRPHYLKHRLPGTYNFSASPVGADERIYLLSEEGRTVVLKRGDRPRILAINRLDETFYASPAIAGSEIFLRGDKHLFCLSNAGER